MIENSLIVADAYLQRARPDDPRRHPGDGLRSSARAKPLFDQDRDKFQQFFTAQATARGLSAAIIIRPDGSTVERADVTMDKKIVLPGPELLAKINETEPQIALIPEGDHVAAAIKLRGYDDMYLYVARLLDPRVVAQLRETQASVSEFANLEARRLGVQIAFALMYTVIALIVLLSAAWIGLNFANRLVAPIRRLIGAANIVSTGNLHIQVPVHALGRRSRPARRDLQQDDPRTAHAARRHRARARPDRQPPAIHRGGAGRRQRRRHRRRRRRPHQHPQPLGRKADRLRRKRGPRPAARRRGARACRDLSVRAQRHSAAGAGPGDDQPQRPRAQSLGARHHRAVRPIASTAMSSRSTTSPSSCSAQRTSAWADIARRIAHEIKNPLTPIQLSAERLRRKYGKSITDDPAVFEQCTDTIVRQVDDIKRMVDEFSSFARMPKPVIAAEDVADTVRQVVFLHARRPCRHRYRGRAAGRPDAGALRPPADLAGAHQHHQERDRSDRRGAPGRARPRPHCRFRARATATTSSST